MSTLIRRRRFPGSPGSATLFAGALVLVLSAALLSACTQQVPLAPACRPFNRNGNTNPPDFCFFFPEGIAMDPLGDLLYVGNTNGDLSFGGGTLVEVDVLRHEHAVCCAYQHGIPAPALAPGAQAQCPCTRDSDCQPQEGGMSSQDGGMSQDGGIVPGVNGCMLSPGNVCNNGQCTIPLPGPAPLSCQGFTCDLTYQANMTANKSFPRDCPAVAPQDPIETVIASAPPDDWDSDLCFCQQDLVDPAVVNCESHRFILADQTVRLGNFAGPIQLLADDPADWTAYLNGPPIWCRQDSDCVASGQRCDLQNQPSNPPDPSKTHQCGLGRTLYLPVRSDPSVTWVQVTRPPMSLPNHAPRPPGINPQASLYCGVAGPQQPGATSTYCDAAHRVQQSDTLAIPDPSNSDPQTLLSFELPPDPFQLVLDRGCKPGYIQKKGQVRPLSCIPDPNAVPPPPMGSDGQYGYLLAAHLSGGEVSAFNVIEASILDQASGNLLVKEDVPQLTDVLPLAGTSQVALFPANSAGQHGTYDLAPRVPGDLTQQWYATSRLSGEIATFSVSPAGQNGGPLVVPDLVFNLSTAYAGTGTDVRQVLFEPGGNRAFLGVNNPPTVAVLDTTPDPFAMPMGHGQPANLVSNIIDICAGSSRMLLARTPQMQDGTVVLNSRLYIACYDAGQIAVVDPDTGDLVNEIQAGNGPTVEALNFGGPTDGGQIDPCVDPFVSDAEALSRGVTCPANSALRVQLGNAGLPPRMYVTAYLDNAVAVVDLDPRSPTFQRVVSRIGLPIPKGN